MQFNAFSSMAITLGLGLARLTSAGTIFPVNGLPGFKITFTGPTDADGGGEVFTLTDDTGSNRWSSALGKPYPGPAQCPPPGGCPVRFSPVVGTENFPITIPIAVDDGVYTVSH